MRSTDDQRSKWYEQENSQQQKLTSSRGLGL